MLTATAAQLTPMLPLGVVLTFTLLAGAILLLWWSTDGEANLVRSRGWLFIFFTSLGTALVSHVLEPIGLLGIGAFMTAVYIFGRPDAGSVQRLLSAAAILVLSAGLMLHRIPGCNNPRVINGAQFSADAIPFTLYLNYDKTLIGLFLLGWCHVRMSRRDEWLEMFRKSVLPAGGLIALMMCLSIAAGYVRFDPKLPADSGLWLGVNLLFTCVAEEALFRGFIQAQLQRVWKNAPAGSALALGIASVLFGMAHAAGGAMYVALATIAGLGYGWIYQRTGGRIEASILTHFTLNTVHFFAFTYPALQQAP